ncbi:phage tail assembly chaperone [Vibrio lentus]
MKVSFTHESKSYVNIDSESNFFKQLNIPDEIKINITHSAKWEKIRTKRRKLISEFDGEYGRHARELRNGKVVDGIDNPTTLSSEQLLALDEYVQALADIPQKFSNPDDVVWPEKPTL